MKYTVGLLVAVLAFAGTLGAQSVYWVATSGSDSSISGSVTAPWKTIGRAAAAVNPGDTVNVAAGTYTERVQLNRSGTQAAGITFQAQGVVVMQGFAISGSFIAVSGFQVLNASTRGIDLASTSSNIALRNNKVTSAVEAGIYINGTTHLIEGNDISHTRSVSNSDADGIRFFGSGTIVRKNVLHDMQVGDSPGQSPHIDCFQTWGPATNYLFEQNICDKQPTQQQGFTIEALNNATVDNIAIRNNVFITRGTGYQPDVNVGDLGACTNVSILNNTMVALNGAVEFAVWIFARASNITVKNNAIYDHGNTGEKYIRVDAGASGVDIGFNSISKSNGVAPIGTPYPGDLWLVNPLFVNLAANDFHLQGASPLVNAGTTVGVMTDFDGLPRITPDIGAFEFAPITQQPLPASVELTWTASPGAVLYSIERCAGISCATFVPIASVGVPTFVNTGLAFSTSYRYRVRAQDATGKWSVYSPIMSVVTPSVAAPLNLGIRLIP